MREENCIFCKIANGEIPTTTIFEDENFRVIFDVAPATKGHALILPKTHFANLYEMPNDLLEKTITLAKEMAIIMTDNLECDGFNLVQNNGETAGQTVFHFHMHLIPRYKDDEQKIGWNPTNPSADELVELQKLLIEK